MKGYAALNILGTPYFLKFGVPLITVGVSIFVKYVTRNDKHSGFKKEDAAVGLDLAITALLILITNSSQIAINLPTNPPDQLALKLSEVPWIIILIVFLIWAISTIVRKFGWEDDNKLRMLRGVILPNIVGIFILLLVVNWIQK